MYAFVFSLVFVCLALTCSAQQRNYTDSFPYTFNQTNNIKAGKTNRLKIGILGSWVNAADTIVTRALAHEINNDNSILPDVGIDIYVSPTPTSSDALLGTLYHINTLGVQGIIGGALSTESRTIQLVSKIWDVPQISSNSLSYTLNNKDEYPYFMRTIPTDSIQIDGIIAMFQKYGWKKAIVVYTNDDYGSGYQRLTVTGASANISFYPVSVSTAATNMSQVQSALSSVIQAVQRDNYRIFVYYAQAGPANLIRAGLNASGYAGPEYVSILTSSITGFYTYGKAPYALNDGAIGFHFSTPNGPTFHKFFDAWNSSTSTNPYPALPPLSTSSYFMADALLAYAHSFDRLLKNGTSFSAIKGSLLLEMLKQNSFSGTTGDVSFDSRGERLGRYAIFSLTPKSFSQAGYYDGLTEELSLDGPIVWGGGSSTIPRDSPYLCPSCKNGRCVTDVGCVCNKGWKGDNCDVHIGSNDGVYGGIGAAVAVMIIIIIAAIFVYRRQRSRLVKSVADKQRSNISRGDIKLMNRIGRGASGEVFKATFRGTEVAVKKILTSSADKSAVEEFELEVAIMCGLRHPNIILFMGSCFDTEAKEMLLVMEFMAKGSLHDVIHNPKFTMSFDMQLHLACQAAQGMNFLHQSTPPIVHRDLKSHNILLDDKWNARISDFGITKFQETTKSAKAVHDKSIGTIYWSSPEALGGGDVTVKADVYSFGVVLWEIFHRQNPYANRDPISVAIDVINNNLRPPIAPETPVDMRDLMIACWDKDPVKRPSFQEIVDKLRSMSMKNPSYSMGAGRVEAPTEKVYLVNTSVQGAYQLWQAKPKAMTEAMILHNGLIRSNMEMYRGYESKYDFTSFMIAFENLSDALNFCVSTQVALMHVHWPIDIVKLPQCAQVTGSKLQMLWNGLRVQMSVYSGVPNCQHDPASERMLYMGPVVERSLKMLRGMKKGSIVVSDSIVDEMNRQGLKLIEPCTPVKCGELAETSRTASIHILTINSLSERDSSSSQSSQQDHPHVLLDMDEETPLPAPNSSRKWEDNSNAPDVDWIVQMKDLDIKGPIGKGALGDYSRATYKSKDVAVKTLVNQRLKEVDLLRLLADTAMMTQMSHPNLLTFHAVCLDPDHLALVSEYMSRGNLKALLLDSSVQLPLPKRMRMAMDIAQGMKYLSSYPDSEMRRHDNLKSNNVLIGKDWEAKVCDYGQGNLKDLARTMTSVGTVAWTAPELLSGEEDRTPKIATYSFGIILWEIYTRQVPYANEHPIRVVSKILCGYRPLIPQDCPAALSELITSCVAAEPLDRPSWDNIISTLSTLL